MAKVCGGAGEFSIRFPVAKLQPVALFFLTAEGAQARVAVN
jgi:hypothetical protein